MTALAVPLFVVFTKAEARACAVALPEVAFASMRELANADANALEYPDVLETAAEEMAEEAAVTFMGAGPVKLLCT